jgi:hypothetical protein
LQRTPDDIKPLAYILPPHTNTRLTLLCLLRKALVLSALASLREILLGPTTS